MLEVKNLTKIYSTKKGVKTLALDNVNIKFPERGMVFLLGKSGSGKSTLLNLCGGLDKATSGEVIVKGRSSAQFSKDDFDSYRNTFVGFIFQEYNILDGFTVSDNIGLALELQGKPKDKGSIMNILSQVELSDYADRKPNTLSGGQKQRIAIARALVKSPEIIMADEPTGALDSATGKQVLDTLKKLSESKLIIIVSHDREFAEIYGDRIIELMDGKVISDVTKTTEQTDNQSVSIINSNTLTLKSGSELTPRDITYINNFLKNSKGEVLISRDEKDITEYKKSAKIIDGNKTTFNKTDESKYKERTYKKEDSQFIKSKLPFNYAFRMGASNLKIKPFRLVMTIFLSFIAFTLLGVTSTMTFYNRAKVTAETLKNANTCYIDIQKNYKTKYAFYNHDFGSEYNTYMDNKDIEYLDKLTGGDNIYYYDFNTVPDFATFKSSDKLKLNNMDTTKISSYLREISSVKGFSYIPENHPLRQKIIAGKYPVNDNEIMISSILYDYFSKYGFNNNGEIQPIKTPEDLFSKEIEMSRESYSSSDKKFKITGIYDISDYVDKTLLNEILFTENPDMEKVYKGVTVIKESLINIVLVGENFYSANKGDFLSTNSSSYQADLLVDSDNYKGDIVNKLNITDLYTIGGSSMTSLKETDSVMSPSAISNIVENFVSANNLTDKFLEKTEKPDGLYSASERLTMFKTGYYYDFEQDKDIKMTKEERVKKWQYIYEFLALNNGNNIFDNITIKAHNLPDSNKTTDINIKVTAIDFGDDLMGSTIYLSKSNFLKVIDEYNPYSTYKTDYEINYNAIYCGGFMATHDNFRIIEEIANNNWESKKDDSVYDINMEVVNNFENTDALIRGMSKAFIGAGIVFALFATLLLFNFISVSIANKNKEIGILRAVGARGRDVFKIFFSESILIVLICFLLSLIGSFILCFVLNNMFMTSIGVRLLVLGLPSIMIMLSISLLVSVLSTFLPVYLIAKKNPVDSIRAL